MITSLPKFRHESHLDLGDGDDIIVLVETYKYSSRSKVETKDFGLGLWLDNMTQNMYHLNRPKTFSF